MTPRAANRAAAKTDSRLATRLAALASLGAACIHFAVAPAHWHEWKPSGFFFVLLAVSQTVWAAVMLVRATKPLLAAGIMLNVGVVALWAVSRTSGAPFGPHAGELELVQGADLCALLLQTYVVLGAGWVWYRGHHAEPIPGFANAVVLLGVGVVVALASTVGVASGLRHGHHGSADAESDHHRTTSSIDHHHGHPEPAVSPPVGPPAAPAPTEAPIPVVVPLDDAHGDHHHDG